jgi:hypothetical protein
MRNALACAVMLLVGSRAYADDPAASPAGPPGGTPPAPEGGQSTPAPEPKADPAYGEQPDPADGGAGYFAPPKGHEYTIKSYPDRSRANVMGLSLTAGAGAVVGAVGVYFHLDSRDKSDALSAHKLTGLPWTPERQAQYDAAHRSAVTAGVLYGIGGALVLGAAIAFMVTEPKMETITITPHTNPKPTALIAPTPGGALVGGMWSF